MPIYPFTGLAFVFLVKQISVKKLLISSLTLFLFTRNHSLRANTYSSHKYR